MWELTGRLTSLKYVQQAISGRAGDSITVRLTPQPVPEWRQAAEAARAAVAAAGGDSSDGEGELTAAERAELLVQLESMDARAKQAKQVTGWLGVGGRVGGSVGGWVGVGRAWRRRRQESRARIRAACPQLQAALCSLR